jgi:putative ABC transport system permease protein
MSRLYRLLLYALPSNLRREFGADMAQLFADQRRAAPTRRARAVLCLAAAGDVLREAAAERLERRPRPSLSPRLFLRAVMSDFRHGFKLLRRYPATSLLAVATLALGIGANTAIFSVVDAVLFRALPYPEPDLITMVWEKRPAEGVLRNVVSPADFLDWHRRQAPFAHVAAFAETTVTLIGQGEPRRVGTGVVTSRFFDVLGVSAARGRTFQDGDDGFPVRRVAVITHGFWQRVLGGDEHAVGRTLTINGNAWEVIGVLPSTFRFAAPSLDIWAPMVMNPAAQPPPSRGSHQLDVYARLKPDVSLAQARDAMDRLGGEIEAENPEINRGHGVWVTTLREEYVGPVTTRLALLFGAVGLVLLIACVNVANLLLARAAGRRREMAVRAALGATRARLVAQGLSESLTIGVTGGVLGVLLAWGLVKALPLVLPEQLSVVPLSALTLDLRVLGFAIALAVFTGMLVGLLPAIAASRREVATAIRDGRGASGIRQGARRALVISEVALATLALVGGGLVLRSYQATTSQSAGFATASRLTAGVSLMPVYYNTPELRTNALEQIEQRLASIPGVRSVGAINLLPLTDGDSRTGVGFEGREARPEDPPTRMHPRIVTPGYFTTMGIPIVRGRAFTPADALGAEPVVIVSEASARRFWPDSDPIGTRVRFNSDEVWRRVVGIAGDVKHWGLSLPTNPMLYWPQAQARTSALTFVVNADVDAGSLATAVRGAISSVDNRLPVADLEALDTLVSRSVRTERAQTILMGAFGVLGLILSAIGIYGVMAQLVTARGPEIGIRMTLGARPGQVLRALLGEGLWQALAGVAIGIAGGGLLMSLGRDVLFGVSPWDAVTLAVVGALVLAAALAACFVPARRAMRTDPVEALRS